jgi:hypothetical protein
MQSKKNYSSWIAWPLKLEPIGCPETSTTNYHSTLREVPQGTDANYLRTTNMKSHFKGMKAGHCTSLKEQANEMHTDDRARRLRTAGFLRSHMSLYYCLTCSFVCVRKELKVKRCWCRLLEARKWAVYQEGNSKLMCHVEQTNESTEWREWSLLGCSGVVDIQVPEGCRRTGVSSEWVVPTCEDLFVGSWLTRSWIKAFK